MTIDDIKALIASDESRTLELKKSTGELKDGMHAACAFLNTEGGWLIFGITPKSLKIVGQQVTDDTQREIAQAIAGLQPAVDVRPEYIDVPEYPGNKVIAMHFDGWVWGERPHTFHGRPYYKVESTTKVMPQDMYDERIRAFEPKTYSWELRQAEGVTLSDLNEKHIRGCIRLGVEGGRIPAIYDDRVEIGNPGIFPSQITPENIKEPHDSYPYNVKMAEALYRSMWLENWGSGAKRIIEACQEQGVKEPTWRWDGGFVYVTFKRPSYKPSQQSNESQINLGGNVAPNPENVVLNVAQNKDDVVQSLDEKILQIIKSNPSIRREDIAAQLSVNKKTVERHLKNLGIKWEGHSKTGHWNIQLPNNLTKH